MEVQANLAVAIVLSFIALSYGAEVGAPFGDFFETSSDNNHIQMVNGGKEVNLILDRSSASGFASKDKYLYGYVGMQLKLVAGDSAGTVTAYYLASGGSAHDEIDFEFLGNVSGEPYILQSNIYAAGVGNREVRHYLWFDPTTDFHTYSVVWNKQQIVFYVDSKPIRVFKNNQNLGVPYPTSQPMGVYSSLWNADDWATRGGLVKTDWSHAPFVASYRNFNIQACSSSGCPANTWWDKPEHYSLSAAELDQLNWVNKNYMIYNYCTDTVRFAQKPPECS